MAFVHTGIAVTVMLKVEVTVSVIWMGIDTLRVLAIIASLVVTGVGAAQDGLVATSNSGIL